MAATRIEKDSMGPIDVPADKLWGAQTQRSLEHFRISTEKMPTELVYALAQTKRAAATVNRDLGLLPAERADAIVKAADEVLADQHSGEFPLAIWQTGSGTAPARSAAANAACRGWCTPTTTLTKARALTTSSRPQCTWRQ